MNLIIDPSVREKLRDKHGVRRAEVEECFANRTGAFLEDDREHHRTVPPTEWFIAPTNTGRHLKIVFIEDVYGHIVLKTAYEPNSDEENLYETFGYDEFE